MKINSKLVKKCVEEVGKLLPDVKNNKETRKMFKELVAKKLLENGVDNKQYRLYCNSKKSKNENKIEFALSYKHGDGFKYLDGIVESKI
jgi:hypothetical protein